MLHHVCAGDLSLSNGRATVVGSPGSACSECWQLLERAEAGVCYQPWTEAALCCLPAFFSLEGFTRILIKVFYRIDFSGLKKSKCNQSSPLNCWNFSPKYELTCSLHFLTLIVIIISLLFVWLPKGFHTLRITLWTHLLPCCPQLC